MTDWRNCYDSNGYGGNGLIGSRIIRKLLERGEEVVSFDLAPPRSNLPLHRHLADVPFYRGDITQIPHLLEAANTHRVDRIIHMAALLPPDTEDRPHFGMLVNIQGTNNVFEVAAGPVLSGWFTPVPSRFTGCRKPLGKGP